jgi:predicted anti-sigma-YlaC factor YlaD
MQDGALDQASTAKLQAHLDECKKCRAYQQEALKLRELMLSVPRPQVPSWLHHQILHQCKAHEPKRLEVRKKFRLQLVPATLAIMLSFVLGLLLGVTRFDVAALSGKVASEQVKEISFFGESILVEDAFFGGGDSE